MSSIAKYKQKLISLVADLAEKELLFSFLFVIVFVALEYSLNLEDQLSGYFFGTILHPIMLFLFYGFVYWGTLLLFGEKSIWSSKPFWLISVLALMVLSLNATMFFPIKFAKYLTYPAKARQLLDSCVIHVSYTVHFLIILPVLYVLLRKEKPRIGFNIGTFHWKPYAIMFLCMLPLIYVSSLSADFAAYYPTCRVGDADNALGVPSWLLVIAYLFTYGCNFLGTEILFRGILVVMVSRYIGKKAILPMVTLYTVWHFGKPLGETISSFFGGYVLGYCAYTQKNIIGGILLHICVAFAMELFAFL